MIEYLLRLLNNGWEFPDAAYKTSVDCNVDYDEVVARYDDYCCAANHISDAEAA
jgi:hypothetical protein